MPQPTLLIGLRCTALICRGCIWDFHFGSKCGLTVNSPWRIVADGQIAVAHADHGVQYGLPTPIDVPVETLRLLADRPIVEAHIQEAIGDLHITFEGGPRLEIFNDSSGYECWQLSTPDGGLWIGRNA